MESEKTKEQKKDDLEKKKTQRPLEDHHNQENQNLEGEKPDEQKPETPFQEDISTDEINRTLQKIARGTGIIFIGTIISMGLSFITTPLIARYLTVSQYGIYSLALTVLSFGAIISSLGLMSALPREISHYKEKHPDKLHKLVSTAFFISLLTSIFFTTMFILLRDKLSELFGEAHFSYPFTIITLSLPFITLHMLLTAITRGLGRVRENIYFERIIKPLSYLVCASIVIILRLDYFMIYVAYVVSIIITLVLFLIEIKKLNIFKIHLKFDKRIAKYLLKFSIPLFFTGILSSLITWMDTLMLGFFKSSDVVGLYNAATPFGKLLPIFLGSFGFLYSPLATRLYIRNRITELKRVYQITTKWIYLLTLPLFTTFFVFPEATIGFIFGDKYISASSALRILSIGFMFHTLLGLNGLSIVVIGKPKLNVYGDSLAVILNFALNILLIPKYGIVGAAIATSSAYMTTNTFVTTMLYREVGVHPFSRNYIKPLIISFALLTLISIFRIDVRSIGHAILILAIFMIAYSFLIVVSKSIDKEDIQLYLAIEKRLGINLKTLKRLLYKFI